MFPAEVCEISAAHGFKKNNCPIRASSFCVGFVVREPESCILSASDVLGGFLAESEYVSCGSWNGLGLVVFSGIFPDQMDFSFVISRIRRQTVPARCFVAGCVPCRNRMGNAGTALAAAESRCCNGVCRILLFWLFPAAKRMDGSFKTVDRQEADRYYGDRPETGRYYDDRSETGR